MEIYVTRRDSFWFALVSRLHSRLAQRTNSSLEFRAIIASRLLIFFFVVSRESRLRNCWRLPKIRNVLNLIIQLFLIGSSHFLASLVSLRLRLSLCVYLISGLRKTLRKKWILSSAKSHHDKFSYVAVWILCQLPIFFVPPRGLLSYRSSRLGSVPERSQRSVRKNKTIVWYDGKEKNFTWSSEQKLIVIAVRHVHLWFLIDFSHHNTTEFIYLIIPSISLSPLVNQASRTKRHKNVVSCVSRNIRKKFLARDMKIEKIAWDGGRIAPS